MFLTAIVFFIILSILVFIHELGHFAVARWVGVHVEEFGFGLPPRIWGKKIGPTVYSLNWLPIGGFVKLAGEDEEEHRTQNSMTKTQKSHYFWARSKKERGAILLAGVTMNFVLAVGITTYLLTQGVFEKSGRVHIEKVAPGGPAEQAGILKGDIILSVSASDRSPKSLRVPSELIDFTNEEKGKTVELSYLRDGKTQIIFLVPRQNPPAGEGPMGVAISDLEEKKYPWFQAPGKALIMNLERARDMLVGIGTTLWKLAQFKSPGADVAGPIGIAQVTGKAIKFGFRAVLEFMSILSLNLAVLNALPIPALDGGRFLFVFLEKMFGRKVHPAFERSTHQVGMIVLLFLVLLVSINDILRLARGG